FPAQGADLGLEVARAWKATQDRLHALHVDRLDEVVGRAHLQRADRRLHRRVAGDNDDFHARARVEVFEEIYARTVGQLQVGEHDVRRLPDELDAGFAQIARGGCRQSVFADDRG